MAIDLTGGIDPAREYMFAERPDNPEMRDSVSFWVFDDRGQVGLPRVEIGAGEAEPDHRVVGHHLDHFLELRDPIPLGHAGLSGRARR